MDDSSIPTLEEVLQCTTQNQPHASGHFGGIFKIEKGGREFAIKKILLTDRDLYVDRERQILNLISRDENRCPYIVEYFKCYMHEPPRAAYLVLSWVSTCLSRCNPVPENPFPVYQRILKQLALAISYLHKIHIAHRDIKPDNILLTSPNLADAEVKLADFGFARTLRPDARATTGIGTPFYAAPEILNSSCDYNSKVDVWSFGVVAYELLTGVKPFPAMKMAELVEKQKKDLPTDARFPVGYEDVCLEFVKYCLIYRSGERPTIEDVLRHPFFDPTPSRWTAIHFLREADEARNRLQHFAYSVTKLNLGFCGEAVQDSVPSLLQNIANACMLIRDQQLTDPLDRDLADQVIARLSTP